MNDDPIVAEVRLIREKLLEAAGGDMSKLLEQMNASVASWPGPKVTLAQLKAEKAQRNSQHAQDCQD